MRDARQSRGPGLRYINPIETLTGTIDSQSGDRCMGGDLGDAVSREHEDDAALVQRCRAGDASAWPLLVSRYQRLVYAIVIRMGLDEHVAADVFQTVFEKLVPSCDAGMLSLTLPLWPSAVKPPPVQAFEVAAKAPGAAQVPAAASRANAQWR